MTDLCDYCEHGKELKIRITNNLNDIGYIFEDEFNSKKVELFLKNLISTSNTSDTSILNESSNENQIFEESSGFEIENEYVNDESEAEKSSLDENERSAEKFIGNTFLM